MRPLAVLALAVCISGCGQLSPTTGDTKSAALRVEKPTVDKSFPPETWTHQDLVAHLAKKGVDVDVIPIPFYTVAEKVTVYLSKGPVESEMPMVMVSLCRDKQAASDQASGLGKDAFSAGRFAFGYASPARTRPEDVELMSRVRAALK